VPHRARYLRLNHALARRIVEAHCAWIGDVERELGASPAPASPPPAPEPPERAPEPAPVRRVFRAPFVDYRPARSSRGSPRRPRAGPGLRHARQ
jgi:hypothetical protein